MEFAYLYYTLYVKAQTTGLIYLFDKLSCDVLSLAQFLTQRPGLRVRSMTKVSYIRCRFLTMQDFVRLLGRMFLLEGYKWTHEWQ